ncbi:MAG: DUF3617 domain-containing protein [Rhizobacter sp.]|nr:DUF3617 domain-containing protein [Rhizobacter sp.]
MRAQHLVTFASLLACGAAAQAQTVPPIKPGLWQMQNEREIDGQKAPDMGEHLKKMSPEMRKRMEANMKQHGVDMSGGAGVIKMCQTRESLDQGKWQGDEGQCKTDFSSRSGKVWKWKSVCNQPPSVTEGEAVFDGPESYTVKSNTSMTMQGQARTTKMTIKAKWLGADCGGLKPMTPPQAPKAAKP